MFSSADYDKFRALRITHVAARFEELIKDENNDALGKWGEVVAPVRVPGVLSRYIVDNESHGFVGFSTQRFSQVPNCL